jgi:glutathione S-transferase
MLSCFDFTKKILSTADQNQSSAMNNHPHIIFYGNDMSQPTRAVLWFTKLNNIQLNYTVVRLDKLEHKQPSFLKMNPMGKIPVLSIDNNTPAIFESQAIIHYLRRLHHTPSQWYPENDLPLVARIDSYLNWHGNHFRPGVAGYAFTVIGPRSFGTKITEEQTQRAKMACIQVVEILNNYWLQDNKNIAGSPNVTIADLFAYSELVQLAVVLLDCKDKISDSSFFNKYDNVKRWFKRMEELPHYDSVHRILYRAANHWKQSDSKL